jgi:hypothetical protein
MNLTLNPTKCEYNKLSIEFYGYIFSKDGVFLDQKESRSLPTNQCSTESNASEKPIRELLFTFHPQLFNHN